MSAEEFADEFINDLSETLSNCDLENERYSFCINTYNADPNLQVLKSKLNKIGYDLLLDQPLPNVCEQDWKLVKI